MTAITTDEKSRIDHASSIQYQWEYIQKLQEQVNWFNNPEISPDYILFLKIAKRRIEP
jgi:hypothetical protein